MQNKIQEFIDVKKNKNKNKNIKRSIMSIISVFLVLGVFYSMLVPALTMEQKTLICDFEEHTHSEDCYQSVLICGYPDEDLLAEYNRMTNADEAVSNPANSKTDPDNALSSTESSENETTTTANKNDKSEESASSSNYNTTNNEETSAAADNVESHTHSEKCYKKMMTCGIAEHVHSDICYDKKNETDSTDEQPINAMEKTFENDDLTLTVSLPEDSGIPEEAELKVEAITPENNQEQYDKILDLIINNNLEENESISEALFYDISFIKDGEEVEPAKEVRVSINYKNPAFDKDKIEMASELNLLHMIETDTETRVEEVQNVSYENIETGISDVEFNASSFSKYAIVIKETTVTDTFYERVSTIDSTTANYLLVSPQGGVALTYGATDFSTPVQLDPVKGHPTLYTIENTTVTNNMLFNFETAVGAKNTSKITNVGGSRYLLLTTTTGSFIKTITPSLSFSTSSPDDANLTVEYVTLNTANNYWDLGTYGTNARPKNGWRIHYYNSAANDFYLLNKDSTPFKSEKINGTSTTSWNTALKKDQASYFNMLIYKQVTKEITIPGDVADTTGGAPIIDEPAQKPNYDPYIDTSDKSSGEETIGENDFYYASDKSTSQIESDDIFNGNPDDDGKIWTDKSVIYKGDDYNANTVYDDGTFGVALSALAQQSASLKSEEYAAPIDVVFILDTSSSMKWQKTEDGKMRAGTMVSELNKAINLVMSLHPENRVGIVRFALGSSDILELGRYYASTTGSDAPDYKNNQYEYFTFIPSTMTIKSDNLRHASSKSLVGIGNVAVGGPTYTQEGIHRAYNMFKRNSDTQYTLPDGRSVPRQPVTILLSDGAPTICTSNYMDPLNGPYYGNGGETVAPADEDGAINAKGIMGYYTILSANYFKNMTSIHYNKTSQYHTIGMGIYSKEEVTSSGINLWTDFNLEGIVGDDYKRAVLNPNEEHIKDLLKRPAAIINPSATGKITSDVFGNQLNKLLNNDYDGTGVLVGSMTVMGSGGIYPLGVGQTYIPILKNPYSDYNYADTSYTSSEVTDEKLNELFDNIINNAYQVNMINPNELVDGSYITFEDAIGEDMEIKGDITLRFQGTNYTFVEDTSTTNVDESVTTKYKPSNASATVTSAYGKSIKLSDINLSVTTDADGNQTVKWAFTEDFLPLYTKSHNYNYYFEMLPIRLIFTVGLKDSSTAVANQAYYTNKQGSDATKVTFTPSDENPYYKKAENLVKSFDKTENTTETSETYYTSQKSGSSMLVTLGNNGVLIRQESKLNVEVEKLWKDSNGNTVTDVSDFPDISVQLYRKAGESGTEEAHQSSVTLNDTNSWKHTWTNLDGKNDSGTSYIYYVKEINNGKPLYLVSYVNNSVTVDSTNKTIQIVNTEAFTDIKVEKVWKDYNGQPVSGTGKAGVTVTLYRKTSSNPTGEAVVLDDNPITLSDSNTWNYTWTSLPLKDSAGTAYQYYVIESPVSNYETTYQVGSNEATSNQSETVTSGTITVINKSTVDETPQNGSITVEKSWLDEYGDPLDDSRKQAISVTLKCRKGYVPLSSPTDDITWDSNVTTVETVTLSSPDWSKTWSDLKNQESILSENKIYYYYYYVEEVSVEGFDTTYSDNNVITVTENNYGAQSGVITITNTAQLPMTELPATGGPGTNMFTLAGSILLLLSLLLIIFKRHLKGATHNDNMTI